MQEISNIFKNLNKNYWFQDGGLLGYYRNNDFISHDTDIDFGIHIDDFNLEVYNALLENNFSLILTRGNVNNSLYLKFSKRNIFTDFFIYYDIDKNYFYHCAFDNQNRQINYTYKKFKTTAINFKGVNLLAPDNIEYFVNTKYGEEWHIPTQDWNHITSPKNASQHDISISSNESIEIFKKWIQKKV